MKIFAWHMFFLTIVNAVAAQSVSAASTMIESELADSYQYVDHYEILIEAPPEDVWPHVVDVGEWMHGFDMHHESGPMKSEGEVLRLYEGQDFFFQIVKLIPERMMVAVNLPSSMEGERSVGVSMITLAAFDDKTLVSNFMSRQYDWSEQAPNPVKARRQSEEFREFNRTTWRGFLTRLKQLAEE